MKTVFVSLNSKYIHSSLACWYLLSATDNMKDKDIEASVVEGTINESSEAIIRRIEEENADVLGFSCYIWNVEKVMDIAGYFAQNHGGIKILLGGPEVSYRSEDVLKRYPFVDAVLCGEGEWIITKVLKKLSLNESLKDIEGVSVREEDKFYIGEPYIACETPPDPYTNTYFEKLNNRIVYFESSRGCPFSCAFCLSGRCGKVRYFPFEEMTDRLQRLSASGTRTIKFVDRTFNAHHERTNKWLRFLLEERGRSIPENVCFHFEMAGDLLKEDTLELLKAFPAGMVQLEIGLQSFNKHTLEAVTRKTDVNRLKENIKKLMSFENMHIHLDLIMGLPGEDMAKVAESFNEAFLLRPHMLQVGFLKLLYGAAMREDFEKYPCKYKDTAPYEVVDTPWLSEDDLKELHLLEDAVERIYNSQRLIRTLEYILQVSAMTPFDLFMYIGKKMQHKVHAGISFNEYEENLFEVLSEIEGADKLFIRDYMVIDRLETDPSGRVPGFLRIEDENLRKVKKLLNKEEETKAKAGVKRGIAIIYTQKKAVYADYVKKNPITERFQLSFIDLL